MPKKQKQLTEYEISEIRERYQAGAGILQLSNEYFVSYTSIYRIVEKVRGTISKVCPWCNTRFQASSGKQKYCSSACAKNAEYQRRKSHQRICAICYDTFTAESNCQKYCKACTASPFWRKSVKEEAEACISCGVLLPEGRKGYCTECRDKKTRNSMKSISEICREAREMGMSYGEYVAHKRETAVS